MSATAKYNKGSRSNESIAGTGAILGCGGCIAGYAIGLASRHVPAILPAFFLSSSAINTFAPLILLAAVTCKFHNRVMISESIETSKVVSSLTFAAVLGAGYMAARS